MSVGVGGSGLGGEPVEELVPQEAELAATREAVARDLALTHELPEVLDVDLQLLRSHGRGEHGRELSRFGHHLTHDNAIRDTVAPGGPIGSGRP